MYGSCLAELPLPQGSLGKLCGVREITFASCIPGGSPQGCEAQLVLANTRLGWSFLFNNHEASLVFPPFGYLPLNKFSDRRLLEVSKNMNIIVSQYILLSVMRVGWPF